MNRIAASLACLTLLAPALTATSISYVGKEVGNAVQNWSNTAVVKTRDLNGDDRFGGAGYYQITPGAVGDTWNQAAPLGNDLGIAQVYPTQHIKPPFIVANPSGEEGDFINYVDAPTFKNPAGTSDVRQGSLWLSSDNKMPGNAPGNMPGMRSSAFKFILSDSARFRLGVAVDTLGDGYYAADYVSVSNVVTGEVFCTSPLTRNGSPDMVFFDIGGNVGEEFEVALWQIDESGSDGRVAFALVTFDKAPTPTLTYTQNGSNITLSWETNIPGWILQSSTDLGAGDDWDPVPGVVNNSVSVSKVGVPKNFFRLKTNP
jgi:hypothetical protein